MKELLQHLRSEDKLQILKGLEGLGKRLPSLQGRELEDAVQAVISLFYVDPVDHPELIPVLEQAEAVLVDQRERIIPVILRCLEETDLKAHFHLASVLGRLGYAAVEPLLEEYRQSSETYPRIFALYALGKVKDPKVLDAVPTLFDALEDQNPEVRDTSARALGKLVEHVNPDLLGESERSQMFDRLLTKASDRYSGVRSKAIRSLGKMARFGLLKPAQLEGLSRLVSRTLGETDGENWDVAYIVRAEAEKARRYLP
jgi:HEAT repeat protein